MTLFLALGECGDYYCDSEHPLGIFDSIERVHEAGNKYVMIGGLHPGTPNPVRNYTWGKWIINELNSDIFPS